MRVTSAIFGLVSSALVGMLSPAFAQGAASTPAMSSPAAATETSDAPSCDPMPNGTKVICPAQSPEDLIPVPGTRWILASGFRAGSGVHLIDTDAKTARSLYTGEPGQIAPDKKLFPNCSAAPDPKTFIAHGIYLRSTKDAGRYMLYVVSHGALEATQVFGLDVRSPAPTLTWKGCIPMPAGYTGNAVAVFRDGTVLVTVLNRPGFTTAQRNAGEPTGIVMQWKPGTPAYVEMPGTELSGNNGIELSKDESEFYVNGYGTGTVTAFSRTDTRFPLWTSKAPFFAPDNIRWSGDRLIAAGPFWDDPACGGHDRQLQGGTRCPKGYIVAEINPKTQVWTVIAYAEGNAGLNQVSHAVIVGDTLYIGSTGAAGVGYRPLPHPPTAAVGTGPSPNTARTTPIGAPR